MRKIFNHIGDEGYSNEEYTPPAIWMALGRIDGDPCAGVDTIIGQEFNWTKEDDGLGKVWPKDKFLFVNPPFEQKELAIQKCVEHGNCILLLPLSGSPKWFHELLRGCDAIFSFAGRVKFSKKSLEPKFSTALYCIGDGAVEKVKQSGFKGSICYTEKYFQKMLVKQN